MNNESRVDQQSGCHRKTLKRVASLVGIRYTAADKQRVEAFVRRGVRRSLRPSDPTPTQLTEASDDNLFSNLLTNSNHVLKPLLPDISNHHYNLRHRRHTLTLSIKTDAKNFVVRKLFRDTY